MRIGFHFLPSAPYELLLSVRRYAHYCVALFNVEVVILAPATTSPATVSLFGNLPVRRYGTSEGDTLTQLIQREGLDALYLLDGSELSQEISFAGRTLLHHSTQLPIPPGNHQATICNWLSEKAGNHTPWVNPLVELPIVEEDLHGLFNIPRTALVIGCELASNRPTVPFISDVLQRCLGERADLHLLFLGDAPPFQHERSHTFSVPLAELETTLFVNSCDALLHCYGDGEIFHFLGIHFSAQNKPTITWQSNDPGYRRGHLAMLGEEGIYYQNSAELRAILLSLDRIAVRRATWNTAAATCSPESVMRQFYEVFLR